MTDLRRPPDFIGIGAAKCGTTWVSAVIGDHPDIGMAPEKEVVYFSGKRYALGVGWYLGRFEGVDPSKIVGEFSVAYMAEAATVAPRIHDLRPDTKLIAVLRDPVARARSHLNWTRQLKGAALSADEILDPDGEVLRNSLYHDNLVPFWETFGRERVLVMTYESLTADPVAGFARLFGFLGARPDILPASVTQREGGTIAPRSRWLETARQGVFHRLRKRNKTQYIQTFKRLGLSRLYRRVNDSGARLDFAPEVERALRDVLRPQAEALARDTGLDLTAWRTTFRG